MSSVRWAIGFVTLERPLAAQRFVRSARRVFPEVPIFVADQSRAPGSMADFYAAEQVTVVPVPFDAGLSASRNALVASMDVDYLALCDDDFILGPASVFPAAIRVLEADPGLAVVGGMLHDFDGSTERVRNWEMFLDYDARHRRVTATPIYAYPAESRRVAGEVVYECDAVLNFAVFRKDVFASGVRWDESIRINGEHEDFYLHLKQLTPWKVAFLPEMTALHWYAYQPGEYSRLRGREEGRQVFLRKWRLRAHLEIGRGHRPLDGRPVPDWFATPADAPDRDRADGISDGLLYARPAPDVSGPRPPSRAPTSCLHWIDAEQVTATDVSPPHDLVFSYRPDVEPNGVLLLWYREAHDTGRRSVPQTDTVGVIVRWFTDQGWALVWDGEVLAVRSSEQRYWQPLVVALPLWPKQATYLRFEVRAAGARRELLATGFVYPLAGPSPGRMVTPRVLAWCRTTTPVLRGAAARVPLAEHLRTAQRSSVEAVCVAGQDWASIDISGLDVLGLARSREDAPALLLAAGGRVGGMASALLAVPLHLLQDPQAVLFAVTSSREEPISVLEPRLVEAATGAA